MLDLIDIPIHAQVLVYTGIAFLWSVWMFNHGFRYGARKMQELIQEEQEAKGSPFIIDREARARLHIRPTLDEIVADSKARETQDAD